MRAPYKNASGKRRVELRQLRLAMAARDLTNADIAARIGYPVSQFRNAVTGNRNSWPILRAVNACLGLRIFGRPRRVHKPKPATP